MTLCPGGAARDAHIGRRFEFMATCRAQRFGDRDQAARVLKTRRKLAVFHFPGAIMPVVEVGENDPHHAVVARGDAASKGR